MRKFFFVCSVVFACYCAPLLSSEPVETIRIPVLYLLQVQENLKELKSLNEQQRVLEQELLTDLQNSKTSLSKERELSNQLLQISSAAKQEFEASERYHKEALSLSEQQRISSERLLKKEKGKTRLLQCLCVVLASVTAGILVAQ